jgi:monoamine oxidase/phosphohistidine phosphatase SixA/SAM-dependent methyltransferase
MARIAIVGGGPGGLMTAYLLERKSFEKHQVTLFEATERVGGKIVSAKFSSAPVLYEAGVAELYDYSQLGTDPLRQLVSLLGLPTVKMYGQTIVLGNRIMRNAGDIKRHFGRKTLKAITDFRKRGSSSLSRRDYYDAGWTDDNKHKWADRSFQSVLSKIPDDNARRFLKVAVHSDLAIEPHSTSALYGMENCLMDDPRYMRYYSIKGGIERLPLALKASISAHIRLNRPVLRVEKTATGAYRVLTRNNGSIESDEFDLVAVALPNYWLPAIEWGGERLETAIYKHHAYYDSPAHYLRISLLFESPFWRKLISDDYFQIDAFGGCCVYDEGARYDVGPYGVLNWLLGGNDALIMSNYEDSILINKALESLPRSLAAGRDLFLEGRVHRWVGTVCARPGGYPIKGPKIRHLPDPEEHPGVILVGDYLFDSTINGVLDSADIATGLMLKYLEKRKQLPSVQDASGGQSKKYLYILRDRQADPQLNGHARTSNLEHRKAIERLADQIRNNGAQPSLVICPPATATENTLSIIAPTLLDGTRIRKDTRLYRARRRELLKYLRSINDDVSSVLLIGGDRSLQKLAVTLASTDDNKKQLRRLRARSPAPSLAVLKLPDKPWRDLGRAEARLVTVTAPNHHEKNGGGNLKKSYFDYYDGKHSYEESFKEYFDEQYIIDLIRIAWGAKPPYRLLDAGSANGLSLAALGKAGVDAWGVENNRYIHRRTPRKLRDRNILGDVRDLPFTDNYFDFVYETCLCYVPSDGVEAAIRELHRVTRSGIFFGSITADANPRLVKKQDLFYGLKTLSTMEEWSNRFLSNGFRLAVSDAHLLAKAWKLELRANEGETWYPAQKSMGYCFYTKEEATRSLCSTSTIERTKPSTNNSGR